MPKSRFNPFAHLLTGKKARASEDEEEKAKKAKKANARRAEEEEEEEEEKAEEEEEEAEEEEAEEEEEEAEEEEEEKARKARKAKGKKAEDDDDDADAKVAKGRRMERKRIDAIMSCEAAAARPDLACYMACKTSLSAASAIEQLNIAAMGMAGAGASGSRMSLDQRMGNLPRHTVGPDAVRPTGKASAVNACIDLYNSFQGKK